MSVSATIGTNRYEFDTHNDYEKAKDIYHDGMSDDEFEELMENANIEFNYDIWGDYYYEG